MGWRGRVLPSPPLPPHAVPPSRSEPHPAVPPPPGPLLPSWSSYCPVHQDFYSGLAVAAQDCPASAFSHVNSDTIRALVGKPRVRYLWGELGGGDSDAG